MSWRAAAALALVAWSALAFGAVYPWAFVPLFAGCAAVGVAALRSRGAPGSVDRPLAIALAIVLAAIAAQLVPVPLAALRVITPQTDRLLHAYAVGYATASRHALSIRPSATALALLSLGALTLLMFGLARTVTRRDAATIARFLGPLGALMALVGIAQHAIGNGRIYGVWTPYERGESFGPFVNRNHFAGWMLMALPVALAYFFGRVAKTAAHPRHGWRAWVVWFASDEANDTVLAGLAALVMALGLMLTMSRSGILGLVVALALTGALVIRHQTTGGRRVLTAAFLLIVAAAALWATGFDRLALRFTERDPASMGGRLGIWRDAWRIVRLFPVAGTGVNTFGVATVFFQTANPQVHFTEAHNDYLQLLTDGGLLVTLPALAALVALARAARRARRAVSDDLADYWIRTGALVGLVAIACQEAVDFSLQIPANATLFVVLMALAIREPSIPRAYRR